MGGLLLAVAIITASLGQAFLKMGINRISAEGFQFYLALIRNPWVYLGIGSFLVSVAVWMKVLKYFDLSFARPLTSIGYVITYLLAVVFLGESFTVRRSIAIVLITAGALLLR